jgi:hypothetical protein
MLQDLTRTVPSSHLSSPLGSRLVSFAAALLLAVAGAASAAPHGGGGGMARGGGGFHGGFARGGFARGGVARGGFGRGYGRPYGYGRRGYGYGGYGYPYWGWGLGLGLGLYLSTLPWDYSTYWWDGVPYYYTGNNYYTWDGSAGEYEQVQPPSQVTQQAANAPPAQPPHLYAYPKNGQSAQQQASDEAACQDWASQQVNRAPAAPAERPGAPPPAAAPGEFTSPSQPAGSGNAVGAIAAATGAPPAATPGAAGLGSEFVRAEAACLQGRGYSVD